MPTSNHMHASIFSLFFLLLNTPLNTMPTIESLPCPEEMSLSQATETLKVQNFGWLIKGVVAGMAQPEKTPATVGALAKHNVGAIIALNGDRWEKPEHVDLLSYYAIEHHSFNLSDPFLPSDIATVKEIVRYVVPIINLAAVDGKVVVFHCRQGANRTWSILGCVLLAYLPMLNEDILDDLASDPRSPIKSSIRKCIENVFASEKKAPNGVIIFALRLLEDKEFLKELIALRSQAVVNIVGKQVLPISDDSGILGRAQGKSPSMTDGNQRRSPATVVPMGAPLDAGDGAFSTRIAPISAWTNYSREQGDESGRLYRVAGCVSSGSDDPVAVSVIGGNNTVPVMLRSTSTLRSGDEPSEEKPSGQDRIVPQESVISTAHINQEIATTHTSGSDASGESTAEARGAACGCCVIQ